MTAEHVELALLLDRADQEDAVARQPYEEFRRRLLRHIAAEEKVLLPFAREMRGEPLAMAAALRTDHGQIARLLVPTPTRSVCRELRALLVRHDAIEEGPLGLYAICDALAGEEPAAILARLFAYPEVPVAKHYDGPPHRRS